MILLIAVLIRSCVGLSPYSGEGIAPKFGDFECHRHWMETTFHYPLNKWYADGDHMNITYWPMDYPPLCAYTHWFMANVVSKFEPNAIKLTSSYGYNSSLYRSIMRTALIILELIALVPPLLKLLVALYPKASTTTRRLYLCLYLTLPSLIFVDHGHFQPNSAMHGMVLWAVYFMITARIEWAVVFMVGAVNFKQMALYFGMPFAFMTLGMLYKVSS